MVLTRCLGSFVGVRIATHQVLKRTAGIMSGSIRVLGRIASRKTEASSETGERFLFVVVRVWLKGCVFRNGMRDSLNEREVAS